MLKFKNKTFRNLQEQVGENKQNIEDLNNGQSVIDEFGIKVVSEVESTSDLPTVAEYKEYNPDWDYGDAIAVGTEAPYSIYILTKANEEHETDYWFDIGDYPVTGPAGADAGFGTVSAEATTLAYNASATATVTTSGPDTAKNFSFSFGIPVGQPASDNTVTISSTSGTLTLAEYNTLDNNNASILKFHAGEYLNYFLKKWYRNNDYLVFLGVAGYETLSTMMYKCVIDRTTRAYTLTVLQPIKVDKSNISSRINGVTNEAAGTVLTADGSGGANWQAIDGVVTVSVTSGTTAGYFSDSDYAKVAGDNCIIVYGNGARYYRKDSENSTTITYVGLYDLGTTPGVYKIEITKSSKYYTLSSSNLSITSSNIKTGSLVSGKYLTTNGSGGCTWGDGPSQVQADWDQTSQSSPAYIKNKPTIPTVPVTDVTVNGTSCLDGTTAKVLVDTVDGVTDGTNWTSLTVNGTTAAIPAGGFNGIEVINTSSNNTGTFTQDEYDKLLNNKAILFEQSTQDYYIKGQEDSSAMRFYPTLSNKDDIYRSYVYAVLKDGTRTYARSFVSHTLPGTKITSYNQSSGTVLTANGSGGSSWANTEGTNIASTGATSGYVLTADGSGGASWAASSGGGGTTLNEYTYTFSTNGEDWTTILNILNNAKGRIKGYISFRFGIWGGNQNFSVNINSMRASSSTNVDISDIQYKQNSSNDYFCLISYNGIASTGSIRVYTYNINTGVSGGSNTADRCNGGSITYWNDTQLHT